MKKIILPIFVLLFSLVFVTPTFASEKADQELEKLSQKGKIVYKDDEITVRSFGNNEEISNAIFNHPNSVVANENKITPLSSVTGSGGRASIVRVIQVELYIGLLNPLHYGRIVFQVLLN